MWVFNLLYAVATFGIMLVYLEAMCQINRQRQPLKKWRKSIKSDGAFSDAQSYVFFYTHHQIAVMEFCITGLFNFSLICAVITSALSGALMLRSGIPVHNLLASPDWMFYPPLVIMIIGYSLRWYVIRLLDSYEDWKNGDSD